MRTESSSVLTFNMAACISSCFLSCLYDISAEMAEQLSIPKGAVTKENVQYVFTMCGAVWFKAAVVEQVGCCNSL